MKFKTKKPLLRTRSCAADPTLAGFTLVEMLVALALMAIVIPVIVQGLRIASLSGEVSQRKALAARVAERVLTEAVLTGQANQSGQKGTEHVGPFQFQWTLRDEPWNQLTSVQTVNTAGGINQNVVNANNIHQLSVDVTFPAQSQTFAVHLSTLVNVAQQNNPAQQMTVPQQ
jgi:prepilin-type N-terminal cleavage/methylation domain-containing protein